MKKTPEDILIAIGNISNITNPLMTEKTVANILKKTNQLKDSHIIIQLFYKLVEMLKKTKRRE